MALKNVLIVGGGIGGLSAAVAFRRAGIQVRLVELQKSWTVYHVGIVVQANFIRAMKVLGIADQAIARGFPYDGSNWCDKNGKVLHDIPGPKLAGPDYPSDLGLARPALHDVLVEAATTLGATISLGMSVTALVDDGNAVQVTFTDGSIGSFDLVVGADGLYSKVRSLAFANAPQPRFTGQGVWRYNVPRPPEVTRAHMYDGVPGGKAGFIPLTQDTMYVLLVRGEAGNPRFSAEKLADLFRERLQPYGGHVAHIRDHQITDASKVVYRPLEVVFVPAPWYRGRIVLLGDSAHGTTPHLGQGAAQAVEDAIVLGAVCASNKPVQAMLDEYMARRYERCKFIWEGSIQIGDWDQRNAADADVPGIMHKMLDIVSQPI